MATVSVMDFTRTPGGREKKDGDFSGEEFREKYLEPLFTDGDTSKIIVKLDGMLYGYPPSFIDEAFGGLARKYGVDLVLQRLLFESINDKILIDEVIDCIVGKKSGS